MNTKPILYEYFDKRAAVMLAEYELSKEQSSSINLGRNREIFVKEFLEKILPLKLSICSGEIWDSENNKTGQLDCVVIRDDCPSLVIRTENIYLVEGILSVIEVKSNLTRSKLKEAGKTFLKVKDLKIAKSSSISSGPVCDRPLNFIFAYEGAKWETLIDEIEKNEWTEIFDLICILDRGVLIRNGRLIQWEDDIHFSSINSKAAALSYLYLYIISYGTSFIGRSMKLNPYFEPLKMWSKK